MLNLSEQLLFSKGARDFLLVPRRRLKLNERKSIILGIRYDSNLEYPTQISC